MTSPSLLLVARASTLRGGRGQEWTDLWTLRLRAASVRRFREQSMSTTGNRTCFFGPAHLLFVCCGFLVGCFGAEGADEPHRPLSCASAARDGFPLPEFSSDAAPVACDPTRIVAPTGFAPILLVGEFDEGKKVVVDGLSYALPFRVHLLIDGQAESFVGRPRFGTTESSRGVVFFTVAGSDTIAGGSAKFARDGPISPESIELHLYRRAEDFPEDLSTVGPHAIPVSPADDCASSLGLFDLGLNALQLDLSLASDSGSRLELYEIDPLLYPPTELRTRRIAFLGTEAGLDQVEVVSFVNGAETKTLEFRTAEGQAGSVVLECPGGEECSGMLDYNSMQVALSATQTPAASHACRMGWRPKLLPS